MNTLSIQRPLPSMQIRQPVAFSRSSQTAEVNCAPWSVLKISGVPKRASAPSSAARQKSLVRVFESRQLSTLRLAIP
jgi:hypothetical protein